MLNIGSFQTRLCQGMSRRAFLRLGAGLPLAGALPQFAGAAEGSEYAKARAKSVILVWLWGAPSHLDMFDPKPKAPNTHRGPFSPIATRTPGVQFTELLP
ncbi:MAG TPA: DUF1501 domain-containing protein, partial [Pirellulales bacterium]|nr:DUF1501 domain-containing protein [Pirellulales bacterium]